LVDELHRLFEAVDAPNDLEFQTWLSLHDLTVGHGPGLVIELGRGYGNSTVVFTDAARSRPKLRVVSIGYDEPSAWVTRTRPRLEQLVEAGWFDPLTVLQQDILETNFAAILQGHKRVLLFWDAHGDEVADAVLNRLMPTLPAGSLVAVHDVFDTREVTVRAEERPFRGGPLRSTFSEVVPLWKHLESRNIDPGYRPVALSYFTV
jgi:cephalosporin hydroxylase